MVSHAREFLNSVCTDIIHLHSRKLTIYRGTFSDFEKQMRERLRNQAKQVEAHERSKKHMQVRRCADDCPFMFRPTIHGQFKQLAGSL